MKLKMSYYPITSTPLKKTASYTEFEPCTALKPYIRCFWGNTKIISGNAENTLVTPDTCMDIIFTANYTDNQLTSNFCGINDRTFTAESISGNTVFSFGIRFYAWGTAMFSEDSLKNTKNAFLDAQEYFPNLKKIIEPLLFSVSDIREIIPVAEQALLKSFNEKHRNNTVIEAIGTILENNGSLRIGELSKELHISERQLERLFWEYIGCSAKSLSSMIRYQNLWYEVMFNKYFDMFNFVMKYGYSDQSHLMNDFKKYHSMNIKEAKAYALKYVGNLQDFSLLI